MKNFGKNSKNFSEYRIPKSIISEKISAHDWKNHFQKLNSETMDESIPLIAGNNLSKSPYQPFKMKALLSLIKKKNTKNKAEGIDKIANEIIK